MTVKLNIKEQVAETIRAYYFHDDKDIVRSMRTAEAILNLLKEKGWVENEEQLLLTDGEIRRAMKKANDDAQLYGDDGNPLPEKEVAKAQLGKVLNLGICSDGLTVPERVGLIKQLCPGIEDIVGAWEQLDRDITFWDYLAEQMEGKK